MLTDYFERHPEALIRGKSRPEGEENDGPRRGPSSGVYAGCSRGGLRTSPPSHFYTLTLATAAFYDWHICRERRQSPATPSKSLLGRTRYRSRPCRSPRDRREYGHQRSTPRGVQPLGLATEDNLSPVMAETWW